MGKSLGAQFIDGGMKSSIVFMAWLVGCMGGTVEISPTEMPTQTGSLESEIPETETPTASPTALDPSSTVTPSAFDPTSTATPTVLSQSPPATPTEFVTPTEALPTGTPSPATPTVTPTLDPVEKCAQNPAPIVAQPLRRLSLVEYGNTLSFLLRLLVPENAGSDAFVDELRGSILPQLPPDVLTGGVGEHRGGFTRLDQIVYQEHVETQTHIAMWFAENFGKSANLEGLKPGCSLVTATDVCLPEVISILGQWVHRRPLTQEQSQFYWDAFQEGVSGSVQEEVALEMGLRDMVTVMLTSPYMVYHVEHGIENDGIDSVEGTLTAFELANRLSYHFWQTLPDAPLFAAAADGSLLEPGIFEAQARRLFQDERSKQSVESFYREWFRLTDLPEMDSLNHTPVFSAFAGEFRPSPTLNDDMIAEITGLGIYHTQDDPTSLQTLFSSQFHVSQSAELSSIYGMQPWEGDDTPPEIDEPGRFGLLTRPGFLATGSANTRPIMKGVFIWEGLLCGEIGPPPEGAAAFPPEPSETASTREIVELLTEQEGSSCAGCHSYLINPYGFATEDFDALGRHREVQRLFDEYGDVVAEVPVNTADTAYISGSEDFGGIAGLNEIIVSSERLEKCFAQNYLRFTFGRVQDDVKDKCALDDLSSRLLAGETLDEVFLSLALRPEFKRRSFAGLEEAE